MNLEIKQLTFGWRDTPLFNEIDVAADSGTMVLLRGENGSGKTTLLNLLAGMIPHFSRGRLHIGDVLLNGRSVAEHPPKDFFPLIAFLPSANINFYLLNTTLAEELMLIEAVLPDQGAAVRERMRCFREFFPETDALLSSSRAALSTGEMLRSLACIYFCQGAQVWLMDEPFRQGAEEEAAAWNPFFRFLQKQGAIIIASTHTLFSGDLPVWRLQNGRLIDD